MVAETKENVNKMFDAVTENVRSAMDAGFRAQRAWIDACGDLCKNPAGSERFFGPVEKFAQEFGPFVGKNIEAMTEYFDTGVRSGMKSLKSVCNTAMSLGDGDVQQTSREMWDVAFDTARTNFDALNRVGTRAMENWSAFRSATCGEAVAARPTPKPSK